MLQNIFTCEMGYGDSLRRYRKAAKLTQEALAEQIRSRGYNVTGAYISMIERGYDKTKDGSPTRVKRDFVTIAADVLDWETNDALQEADLAPLESPSSLSIGEKARLALLDKDLSPEDAQIIANEMSLAYQVVMERLKKRKEETQN